ncbi:PLP-dependent transferase [Neoconidiobolus thromboides FSU 785]|nr:PLP-dependent transferase [Neoconidiobolus thromboides FSU 785]
MVLLNNDNQQAFGDNIKQEFQLDPKLTHLNNGSFGTVPKSVRESRIKWLDAIESHPDLLLLGPLQQNLQKPLKRIANIIGANPEDVVFIKNATQGINVVLRSLELTEKDTLFYFNTAYNSVNVLIQFLNEKQGVNLIEFRHKPVSDRQLIESVKQAIEQAESNGIKITVAVLDAIISVPGLILPYEELAILFKEHGAKVVVDGAHAFGQIKLNIAKTKVDFFSTTLHKWGYAYRPTSVLYY